MSCIFHGAEHYVSEIPQQRLVFFVKHAVQQLEILRPSSIIGGQIGSVLTMVFPSISTIYGEFWADILKMIGNAEYLSTGDDSLFSIHVSLRLVSLLRKPHMLEANDDLLDAWNEQKVAMGESLLRLLIQFAGNVPRIV